MSMNTPPKFGHRMWFTSVGIYLGLACVVGALWGVSAGLFSPWWFVLSFVMHSVLALCISIGHHRLFCHKTYETSRPFELALMVGCVMVMYGSPFQWSVHHTTHHKYSDTPLDPHVRSWRYLFGVFHHKNTHYVLGSAKRLLKDPMQKIVHRYFILIWLVVVGTMLAASPTFALFAYFVPVFSIALVGITHQSVSHMGGRPRDWPALEFILPGAGEWYHKTHHERPGAWRQGRFDLGAAVIQRIRTDKPRLA